MKKLEMKKLEIKVGCHIQPYKNKQLEVIRNNEKVFISDGHVEKGDIVILEVDLANKILNTIFGDQVIAIEINEDVTDNDNTEEQNNEDEDVTDNTNTEEQPKTNTRRGRKSN